MRKLILGLFTILLCLPVVAQNNEGSFIININESKNKNSKVDATSIEFAFKGDKFLVIPKVVGQAPGQAPSMIFDIAKKEMIILMNQDGKRSAMIMDLPDVSGHEMVKGKTDPGNYKITSTKERKIIEGYEAVKVLVEGDDVNSEIWVTNQVKFDFNEMTRLFSNMSGQGGKGAMSSWDSYGIGGFPLMVIVKDKNGKEEMIMTITNIKDKVDNKIFSLEGYQTMEMKK